MFKTLPEPKITFPKSWTEFVDEVIPNYVKRQFFPKEQYRDKPFKKDDAHFFTTGILELSDLFNFERKTNLSSYFASPRYRSSYLLYFFPLHSIKFLTLFQLHEETLLTALKKQNNEPIHILDLGCGPATATLSFLMWIQERAPENKSKIMLHMVDSNGSVLEDAKHLVALFLDAHPELKERVTPTYYRKEIWKYEVDKNVSLFLTLMGNVLNESSTHKKDFDNIEYFLYHSPHAGVLMLEPANEKNSQRLANIRNDIEPLHVIGPCLHNGQCPLSEGKNWCFFSYAATATSKWFDYYSMKMSGKKEFVKFSYLWISPTEIQKPFPKKYRKVISQPLAPSKGHTQHSLLICEPNYYKRLSLDVRIDIDRGRIIELEDEAASPKKTKPIDPVEAQTKPARTDKFQEKQFVKKEKFVPKGKK